MAENIEINSKIGFINKSAKNLLTLVDMPKDAKVVKNGGNNYKTVKKITSSPKVKWTYRISFFLTL